MKKSEFMELVLFSFEEINKKINNLSSKYDIIIERLEKISEKPEQKIELPNTLDEVIEQAKDLKAKQALLAIILDDETDNSTEGISITDLQGSL